MINITDVTQISEGIWQACIDGTVVKIITGDRDVLVVLEEAFSEYTSTCVDKRVSAYPTITQQLDMIYHDIDNWRSTITAIKQLYPKG